MSNADIRGRFVWHELMTTDPEAATAFYTKIVPWKTQSSGMPAYTLWMSGKYRAGGLMALSAEGEAANTPPHWLVYIGTPNVDETAAAAQRLGGKVLKAGMDIPNVGRFAVLADPQGAAFAVFTPGPGSDDGVPPGGEIGDFTWHELATTDPSSALRFYSELFGWSRARGHDMGEMGTYHIIAHGGQDVGGAYKVFDASIPPSWLGYVRVADVAKATSAAKAAGGRVIHGPMEVPGGSWITMLLDPQGGAFAVVEAPKVAAKPAQPAAPKQPPALKSVESVKVATVSVAKPAPAPKPLAPEPSSKAPASAAKPARKASRKKAPVARKSAAKRKKAPQSKSAARATARKRPAGKRAAAKKKGASAKRGSATKRVAARKSARGKGSRGRSVRGKGGRGKGRKTR